MEEEESDHIKSTNLVYIELGKFNVNFEHIVHYFKDCVKNILIKKGLKDRIYADYFTEKLTADPIKTIFQSVMYHFYSGEGDQIKIKNLITHCFWAIGSSVEKKLDPLMIGIKSRISKEKVTNYNLEMNLDSIRDLNEKVEEFSMVTFELSKITEKKTNNLNKLEDFSHISFRNELKRIKTSIEY